MSISAEQLNQLHVHGLYSNLQRLGDQQGTLGRRALMKVPLMLSLSEFSSSQLEFNELSRKCQMLVYYGNALYEDELYKKAEAVYIEALKIIKSLAKCKSKSTGKQNEAFSEVEVKFKLFKCYLKMKSYREAMATLESIPSKQRAPKVNMQLGKLYQKHGMERFSSVALEAVICLVNLGISQREIHSLLSSNSTPPEWLLQYMKGYTYATTSKHCKAVQLYKNIELQTLRDNVPLLASMGRSFYMNGDVQQSISCFEKVRLRDKLHLEHMDVYAQLLEKEGKKRELEKLAQELTDVSHVKAEPWIVMAYYCSSINQETKAVYFAQKGHILDTTNIQALLLKASLLQSLEKYQESIQHYREAIRLAPNQLEPYEGLVECHISDEKFKEAINVARNALKTIGTTPRTLTLCAQAYLQDFSTQDKGKAMLLKALSTDACHLPAVYLYVELLIRDEEYKEAVENLQKVLERRQTSKLYQLYGDALKGMGEVQKGLEQYSKAIRLDPDNRKAKDAMEMVECINESELDVTTMEMHEPRNRSSMEVVNEFAFKNLKDGNLKEQGKKDQKKSTDFGLGINEDSNASYPSPAPPSEDSNLGFPNKKSTRKRTASGNMINPAIDAALGLDDSRSTKFDGDDSNIMYSNGDSNYGICEDSNSNLPGGSYTNSQDSNSTVGFSEELRKAASGVASNKVHGEDSNSVFSGSQDSLNYDQSDMNSMIDEDNSKDSDTFPVNPSPAKKSKNSES